jgi:hypothetical protein
LGCEYGEISYGRRVGKKMKKRGIENNDQLGPLMEEIILV